MKPLLALATAALVTVPAASALAYNAVTTAPVNMRTGPDLAYPPIIVIPPNAPVTVFGCLNGWLWCDVVWGPHRGWVAGSYLAATWQNRPVPWAYAAPRYNVPIITFQFGTYWDSHYRNRAWYQRRDHWSRWDFERRRWHP
jgi:uncharacterized protein YraI